ncbi:hypothetical protein [Paraburkholderia silvatlantica]|uniref:Secreted protein n=1 Tax=Paraburkholderia silvatlantica TaxID=321895 RepID=A0ABR6FIQ2_9BURK|nr:hypothetical protein [Paraburkholderia silvatlantica]MBB2927310.1 hypothetical protein [Paraburkholderia silvatlantica]
MTTALATALTAASATALATALTTALTAASATLVAVHPAPPAVRGAQPEPSRFDHAATPPLPPMPRRALKSRDAC